MALCHALAPLSFREWNLAEAQLKSYFRSARFILLEDVAFYSKMRSYDHMLTRRLARLFPPSYTKPSPTTFRPGLSTPAFFLSMPFRSPRRVLLGISVNKGKGCPLRYAQAPLMAQRGMIRAPRAKVPCPPSPAASPRSPARSGQSAPRGRQPGYRCD